MDPHSLELSLPPEASSVATAREKLCAAVAPDFPEDDVETLRLLVSEVVTNAVRHGGNGHAVEVNVHWNSEVRVEVSDHGDGFTPHPRLGALDEPGGFGLYLVGRLADRWGVENSEGTTVWFVLRRR